MLLVGEMDTYADVFNFALVCHYFWIQSQERLATRTTFWELLPRALWPIDDWVPIFAPAYDVDDVDTVSAVDVYNSSC